MASIDNKSGIVRKKCNSSEAVPILYYSRYPGKAEPIRFCFAYGNIDFVDVRFPPEKWITHYKGLSPFGLCPWLEVDGVQYAESQAILQYAAKRAGLIPQNPDVYISAMTILEVKENAEREIYGKVKEEMAKKSNEAPHFHVYLEIFSKLMATEFVRELLCQLDATIAKTQDGDGHVVGGELTFADMSIATYTHMLVDLGNKRKADIQELLPHMYKCMELVYSLPSIHKYVLNHNYEAELHCDTKSVTGHILSLALSIADICYTHKSVKDIPRLTMKDETVAQGFRSCCLWINSRRSLIPPKSSVHILGMWSLVDLICNMSTAWGSSSQCDSTTLQRVNHIILKTQSREGFCIGHVLTLADLAAASFYEFYLNGHSIGVPSSDLEGFRNAHRLVYQIPNVLSRPLKCASVPMLVYFNFAGKAEAIRFFCHATNIPFTDIRLSLAQWASSEHKKRSPTGKLPYMIIDDEVRGEQTAILTYLAARYDMRPATMMGRYHAQAIESALHDLTPTLVHVFKAKTADEKTAVLKAGLIDFLDNLENLIVKYKPVRSLPQYLIEDRLTYVDFLVAGLMAGFPEELHLDMSHWPSCKAIYDSVLSIPQVSKYREERGPLESLLTDESVADTIKDEFVADTIKADAATHTAEHV